MREFRWRHPDHPAAAARERRPPDGARRRPRLRPVAPPTSSGRAPRRRCACRSTSTALAARAHRDRDRLLDHLLTLWPFHAGFDLELLAGGDLDVDEHHTVEDVLAALGDALAQALGDRQGIARYGAATVPMDEASATAAVDLVRRPHAEIVARVHRRSGRRARPLAAAARARALRDAGRVHVTSPPPGTDDHHVAEAAFKALGRALREACARGGGGVHSTKGLA